MGSALWIILAIEGANGLCCPLYALFTDITANQAHLEA